MQYLYPIDMTGNEIQNLVLQNLAAEPQSLKNGLVWFDTVSKTLKYYNGTGVITINDVDISGKIDKAAGAIEGNYATFKPGGGIIDSGSKPSDFLRASIKGIANGIAELDETGKVLTSQLPSYVDDVCDLLTISDTAPIDALVSGVKYYAPTAKKIYTYTGTAWDAGSIPESGKIYVVIDSLKTLRWSGTVMTEIPSSIVIGTTQDTAASGNRGLPPGGTGGQWLRRADGADYASEWANLPAGIRKYSTQNPLLTQSGGVCTWTVTHALASRAAIVEVSLSLPPYTQIFAEVQKSTADTLTISMVSSADIPANTYTVTVIA